MRGGNDRSEAPEYWEADSTLTIEYTVPVLCQVNPRTGRVERVKVLDEEISEPETVYECDGSEASKKLSAFAKEIAAVQPWPAWEFGN